MKVESEIFISNKM